MRAIATPSRGPVDRVEVIELPIPAPGAGEVRVKVEASAVNPADFKVATGATGAGFIHAKTSPLMLGYDFSGVVDAAGDSVDGLREGDPVFGHLPYARQNRRGAFAEYVVIGSGEVGRKPEGVPHATAAAAATAGLTALQGLRDRGGLASGGRALIVGASGGVGSLAVLVAKQMGATVAGICSTRAVDFVRELGADEVIDRSKGDPFAGDGTFDVVFDTPAAYSYHRCRRRLAPGGAYVTTLPSVGLVTGKLAALLSSRRCLLVVVKSTTADLEQLGAWLEAGMKIPIETSYPIRDAASAIAEIGGGGRAGRIILDVAGGW